MHGSPLQYSCLESPTGRGVWWVAQHRQREQGKIKPDRGRWLGMSGKQEETTGGDVEADGKGRVAYPTVSIDLQ